jgi:release factor glutamine methyltransferase
MSEVTDWTIQKLIHWTTGHFGSKGIDSARLDAELLLAATLRCKRLDLYLRFDQPLAADELKNFKALVVRRAAREPVAYILGQQEFYNRTFLVSPGVLIPRPETEHLIDKALSFFNSKTESALEVLDVGCGSGAIAVTLGALELRTRIRALDISPRACEVTKSNSDKENISERMKIENISFENWSSDQKFDLVVSNPPYISLDSKDALPPEVRNHEPQEALFGGQRGDEILSRWLPKMAELLKSGGLLLCEIGYNQSAAVEEYARATGILENIGFLKDYAGHNRILHGSRKET